MTLIKLDDAIADILAAAYEGSQGEAIVGVGDAIAALRALPTVSDGWEDMSSAPETGETILVYRPDAGVFTAHYVEEDAHLSSAMNPPEGDFFWFTTGGEDLTDDMPTHWRPLPAPPSE